MLIRKSYGGLRIDVRIYTRIVSYCFKAKSSKQKPEQATEALKQDHGTLITIILAIICILAAVPLKVRITKCMDALCISLTCHKYKHFSS